MVDIPAIREQLLERGYARLSIQEDDLLPLAHKLGTPTPDTNSPDVVRVLQPHSQDDSEHRTLSSIYGFGAFPFHTEAAYWRNPADLLLLYCKSAGIAVRPTLVQDSWSWKLSGPERIAFARELFLVKRTIGSFLCTTIVLTGGNSYRVRLDEHCLSPVRPNGRFVLERLQREIANTAPTPIEWQAHFAVVIDNRRMLHARGSAAILEEDRCLERVLITESKM